MRKIFDMADEYIKQCDWVDLALIKFCLCSIGILIGICVPKKAKKYVIIGTAMMFVVTYVPLMMKLFRIAFKCDCKHR